MRNSKKVLEIARYIVKEGATLNKVADHFKMSKRTIQLYLKELRDIDVDIYEKVEEIKNSNQQEGKIKGGKNSKSSPKNELKKVEEIAKVMVNEDLTIKEAALRYDMKESTLYDNLLRIEQEKLKRNLDLLFENHRKNK